MNNETLYRELITRTNGEVWTFALTFTDGRTERFGIYAGETMSTVRAELLDSCKVAASVGDPIVSATLFVRRRAPGGTVGKAIPLRLPSHV